MTSHTLAPTSICDLSHRLCWRPLTDLGHISSVTYVCHPLWFVSGHRKGFFYVSPNVPKRPCCPVEFRVKSQTFPTFSPVRSGISISYNDIYLHVPGLVDAPSGWASETVRQPSADIGGGEAVPARHPTTRPDDRGPAGGTRRGPRQVRSCS